MYNEKLTSFAIGLVACMTLFFSAFAQNSQEISPHAEALMLVFSTQQEIIRKVDQNHWWFDIEERKWIVKRPFRPGYIDSTHTFFVSYMINEKVVARWSVDTKYKEVSLMESK